MPGSRFLRQSVRGTLLATIVLLSGACSPESIFGGNDALPPGTADPADTRTPGGALAAYNGALVRFRDAYAGHSSMSSHVAVSALLADELQASTYGAPIGNNGGIDLMWTDSRSVPEVADARTEENAPSTRAYPLLQGARAHAYEARGLLARYAPNASPALRGHLYALTAYLEISLAELFCSGVPLSTVDFEGDFSYRRGSTTAEVFAHAIALMDSALALSADSARIAHLAAVGRARALLALGRYAEAADAVSGVPTSFRYELHFSLENDAPGVLHGAFLPPSAFAQVPTSVADGKGTNGLDYVSAEDPRVRTIASGTGQYGLPLYRPVTASPTLDDPVAIASGIEARLVEAEAALQSGGASWLAMLDELRTDGTFTTQPNPDDPAATDTSWNAGSGGVSGLHPLEDPGTGESRVDLLFRERAFWLFLGGQRQGDLRRLVREYGRDPAAVYPTGAYAGVEGIYGEINAPIPARERLNPFFTGCLDRNP